MEKQINVTVDGEKCGFTVKFNNTGNLVLNKATKRPILFKSLKLLNSYMNVVYHINDPLEYSIFVRINTADIPFEYFQEIFPGIFQMFASNGTYNVFMPEISNVTEVGYIVFDDGDEVRTPKEVGYKNLNHCMGIVRNIMSDYPKTGYPYMDSSNNPATCYMGLKCERNKLMLYSENLTSRIYVISNGKLMDINQARKENSERCFPFMKNMDKFKTLYLIATRDNFEFGNKFRTDDLNHEIVMSLMNDIRIFRNYNEEGAVKYVPVKFNGYINIIKNPEFPKKETDEVEGGKD